jgi:hypothetical protein
MGRSLAPLDGHCPQTIDHGSARLGDGMAAARRATLELQEIHRVFGRQQLAQLATPTHLRLILAFVTGSACRLNYRIFDAIFFSYF